MSPKDMLLALLVVVLWGVNFVIIKVGLHGMPPMLLGALRFIFAALPAVLLVKRPALPWRWLIAYAMTISVCQFAFLFTALYVGMPAGQASLVLQAQAFFTLVFARAFLGEPIRPSQVLGYVVAGAGLAIIGLQIGHAMTILGFALTLCAAVSWSAGNIITRKLGRVDMLGVVVWGSLVPPLPFLGLSWLLEGPHAIHAALVGLSLPTVLAIAYIAYISTLVGYGLWSRLLSRYPASLVAPFSLLVPPVGLTTAWLALGERLNETQVAGIALVMAGLAISALGERLLQRMRLMTARPGAS